MRRIFQVSPHTGTITLSGPLDRETVSEYSFTIVATDGATQPLTDTATVVVRVLDVNDNPPVFYNGSYTAAGKI